MKKKILAFLLACTLAVGMAVSPVGTETVRAEEVQYKTFTISSDKSIFYQVEGSEIAVTGYGGKLTTVDLGEIEKVEGIPVTSIGRADFNGCSSLKSVSIPGSVKSIDDCAFAGCSKLSISAVSKNIAAGKKVTLTAKLKTSAGKPKVKWKSGNEKYATVNSKGVVTTKKAGKGKTVTVTATSIDGTNKKASVKIKIE